MKVIAFALVGIVATSHAYAYCSAPRTPSFYGSKPHKPTKPFCINEFSNTHTCSDWEIRNYNSEVELYNSQIRSYQSSVNSYISDLNTYLRKAKEFAECEIRNLD